MWNTLERVFCENRQPRAKGVIIQVRDPAAKHPPNLELLWKYCTTSKLLFSIPLILLLFFPLIQIDDDYCATNYYFFNISNLAIVLQNCEWKDFFVANLSRVFYMVFHWSPAWPHWHPLKWGGKTVNFFGGKKTQGLFLRELPLLKQINRVCICQILIKCGQDICQI